MNEQQACRIFLRDTLRGDATLAALVGTRVYRHPAPKGPTAAPTPFPLVTFQHNAGGALQAAGATDGRIWTTPLFLIQAIDRGGSSVNADTAAAALDAALQGAQGEVTVGGQRYRVTCAGMEAPFELQEEQEGQPYWRQGGLYRFYVEPLP